MENANKFESTQIISNQKKPQYVEDYTVPSISVEKIVDWESRIAAYSQETKELYYTGFRKFKELEDMFLD